MEKSYEDKTEGSDEYPELSQILSKYLSEEQHKSETEGIEFFWHETQFKLGDAGKACVSDIKNYYYNGIQPNWGEIKESCKKEIDIASKELKGWLWRSDVKKLSRGYLFALFSIANVKFQKDLDGFQKIIKEKENRFNLDTIKSESAIESLEEESSKSEETKKKKKRRESKAVLQHAQQELDDSLKDLRASRGIAARCIELSERRAFRNPSACYCTRHGLLLSGCSLFSRAKPPLQGEAFVAALR